MLRPALFAVIFAVSLTGPALAAPSPRVVALCFGEEATIADHKGEIVGTSGDDVIVGDAARNIIYGEGGNDRICSGAGDDDIDAACSEYNGTGVQINTGPGNDFAQYCGEGAAELLGEDGDDFLGIYGGSFGVLRGGTGNDDIDGSYDETVGDRLFGEDGNDELSGDEGDDALSGGRGVDKLYGEEGFDTLDGGTSKTHRPKRPARIDRDLCQVGPGGGTTTNCEREV